VRAEAGVVMVEAMVMDIAIIITTTMVVMPLTTVGLMAMVAILPMGMRLMVVTMARLTGRMPHHLLLPHPRHRRHPLRASSLMLMV